MSKPSVNQLQMSASIARRDRSRPVAMSALIFLIAERRSDPSRPWGQQTTVARFGSRTTRNGAAAALTKIPDLYTAARTE